MAKNSWLNKIIIAQKMRERVKPETKASEKWSECSSTSSTEARPKYLMDTSNFNWFGGWKCIRSLPQSFANKSRKFSNFFLRRKTLTSRPHNSRPIEWQVVSRLIYIEYHRSGAEQDKLVSREKRLSLYDMLWWLDVWRLLLNIKGVNFDLFWSARV